jgi:hypothetical protein
MKTQLNKASKKQRGALMAAALLMMVVMGMFMSAWVSLMSSRAVQVSLMQDAVQRRISVENSRMFAWQCSMDKGFETNNNNLLSNQSGLLGVTYGGVNTFDGWNSLNVFNSTRIPGSMSTVFPYNYNGVRPAISYLTTEQFKRPGSLTGVDDFNSFSFMKSYPPVLAGDLFTYYRKPSGGVYNSAQIDVFNTGNGSAIWVVDGRTVVRDPASFFASTTASPVLLPFQSKSLSIQSHDVYNARGVLGTAIGGLANLVPSNLPSVPSTTGPVSASSTDRFRGFLNVIKNDLNTSNSLWHFMDREKAAGRTNFVTLDVYTKSASTTGPYWMDEYIGGSDLGPYPIYGGSLERVRVLYVNLEHSDLTHLRITNPVNEIVFLGQTTTSSFADAGRLPPIMIAIVQDKLSPPLIDIKLVGNNNRRVVLGVKVEQPSGSGTRGLYLQWMDRAGGSATFSNVDWRMVFINEGEVIKFKLPSTISRSVRWIGGVMTNFTVKRDPNDGITANRLTFVPDASVPITGTLNGPAYASLIPRDAWLESYFLPVPP